MCSRRKFKKLTLYFERDPDEVIDFWHFQRSLRFIVGAIQKFGRFMIPVAFSMKGDMKILMDTYKNNGRKYKSIEQMIMEDVRQDGGNGRTVARAVLWIMRHLDFITDLVRYLMHDHLESDAVEDLKESIHDTYMVTVGIHQGWFGMHMMNVLIKNFPVNIDLLFILGQKNCTNKKYYREIEIFCQNMSLCVRKLEVFYYRNNIDVYLE